MRSGRRSDGLGHRETNGTDNGWERKKMYHRHRAKRKGKEKESQSEQASKQVSRVMANGRGDERKNCIKYKHWLFGHDGKVCWVKICKACSNECFLAPVAG